MAGPILRHSRRPGHSGCPGHRTARHAGAATAAGPVLTPLRRRACPRPLRGPGARRHGAIPGALERPGPLPRVPAPGTASSRPVCSFTTMLAHSARPRLTPEPRGKPHNGLAHARSSEGRSRHAFASDHFDRSAVCGGSRLAIQPRLGILSERRSRAGGADPRDPIVNGPHLKGGVPARSRPQRSLAYRLHALLFSVIIPRSPEISLSRKSSCEGR